jgi:putative ABC transport system substrate-binding protein
MLLSFSFPIEAQQPVKKVPRIGFLFAGNSSGVASRIEAFHQGLHERDYVQGQNIVIEYRYGEGKLDSVMPLAAELVRLKVDVIVTGGPTDTRAAKQATTTIPIVMAQDSDPVGNGFVASLARPGGNITGLSTLARELSGKRLELLKEIVPKLSRVAVLGSSSEPGNAESLRETELAAGTLGAKLQYEEVRGLKDIETAFRAASMGHADGVLVLGGPVFGNHRTRLANLAVKSRLPAIYQRPEFVEDGGLMSYATSFRESYRRAAFYVDKILKGAKPGDLPVEQPTKFELVINLKTAKQIGVTIPQSVLSRADRVIK